MHSDEYKILSHLYATNGKCTIAYKNTLTADELVFFDQLIQKNQIAYAGGIPDGLGGRKNHAFISITKSGMMAFLSEKERLDAIDDQASNDAKHKSAEKRFSLVKLLLGFLKSFPGLNLIKFFEDIESIF